MKRLFISVLMALVCGSAAGRSLKIQLMDNKDGPLAIVEVEIYEHR